MIPSDPVHHLRNKTHPEVIDSHSHCPTTCVAAMVTVSLTRYQTPGKGLTLVNQSAINCWSPKNASISENTSAHTHNKIICNHKGIWMDFKGFLNPDRNCFLLSRNNGKRWAIRWTRFLASKVCTWQISRQDGELVVKKHDIKLMWLWLHLKRTTRNPQNIWRLEIFCVIWLLFLFAYCFWKRGRNTWVRKTASAALARRQKAATLLGELMTRPRTTAEHGRTGRVMGQKWSRHVTWFPLFGGPWCVK